MSILHLISVLILVIDQTSKTKGLINSNSEVNIMTLAFAIKLRLKFRLTNISIQKIDGTILEIYGLISALF